MKAICASLLMALFLALPPTAWASTTWYVNSTTGSDNNDCKSPTTACKTIGHAISLAASGDSISVAAATYTENLTIGISLKILGTNASTTIVDGGGVNSVVTISSGPVTLSNLTIRNGDAPFGGGIFNNGTLGIIGSTVSGNIAAFGGGIFNNGTLRINHSTLSGNIAEQVSNSSAGGGIYNSGSLTINESNISGNTSGKANASTGSGGGIYNHGVSTIISSAISGNQVVGACLNLFFQVLCYGGGISSDNVLTINNSTVSNNTAGSIFSHSSGIGGGISTQAGTLTISNTTLNGNAAVGVEGKGGGISQSSGTATLQNTIVANSTMGGNCSGTMTSNGYNLSSDGTCNFNNTGDLNNTDPKLGPLQNNGGPTQTQALLPGSPAIDAGNPSGCTDSSGSLLKTDQRGAPRPDKEDSGGCDMGAYESQTDNVDFLYEQLQFAAPPVCYPRNHECGLDEKCCPGLRCWRVGHGGICF